MSIQTTINTSRSEAISRIRQIINSPGYLEKMKPGKLSYLLEVVVGNELHNFWIYETEEELTRECREKGEPVMGEFDEYEF